jgi:hypothetical protein
LQKVKMVPLGKVDVIMAADPGQVIARLHQVNKRGYPRVENMSDMREGVSLAIVGGGPSLKDTLPELKKFRRVMVCGSAHDYVASQGIRPTWTVISDPDPVMAKYLTRAPLGTKYLVASFCSEEVFGLLRDREIFVWNCGDTLIDSEKWQGQGVVFGGGCTVLTRAIVLAVAFGYQDLHFFGCDTSISEDGQHHAYSFVTDEEETGEIVPIQLRLDGPVYQVPNYLVAQLQDLQTLIAAYAHRIKVTVHGGGLFAGMMAEADRRRRENGNG